MTDFVITITDPEQLAGIAWAREEYNRTVPPDPETGEPGAPIATDAEYVAHVMTAAAVSYAAQRSNAAWEAARTSAVADA